MQWFCRLITTPDTRLVRVKSWRPFWGRWGIEWPVMLVDRGNVRSTVAPVWDRWQFRVVAYRLIGKEAPDLVEKGGHPWM